MFVITYSRPVHDFLRSIRVNWRLLIALAKRDLSDEYVSHTLSLSWNVVHPLFAMLVYLFIFTVIFPSKIAAPPGHATNAVVYLLAGMIPWLVFSQVLGRAPTTVVGNGSIVKQMAFPLELLPIKALAGPLVFGAISLAFLICYSAWITRGSIIPAYAVGLPLLLLLSLLLLAGISLILSCAQVFLRDLKEFVSMFVTIGLFTHPILYFPNAVPAAVRPLIYISPISYFIFCWQDVMFYGAIARPWAWLVTSITAVLLFAFGARLFLISKNSFGDFL